MAEAEAGADGLGALPPSRPSSAPANRRGTTFSHSHLTEMGYNVIASVPMEGYRPATQPLPPHTHTHPNPRSPWSDHYGPGVE